MPRRLPAATFNRTPSLSLDAEDVCVGSTQRFHACTGPRLSRVPDRGAPSRPHPTLLEKAIDLVYAKYRIACIPVVPPWLKFSAGA